jgi:16S rRNA C967 or C1407 C5-methylase (RsmB/RsmF family)
MPVTEIPSVPARNSTLSAEDLSTELGYPVKPVSWLPGFFALPDSNIAHTEIYKSGRVCSGGGLIGRNEVADTGLCFKIQGMDVSSGVAVAALSILSGDHVLDLCCAPGACSFISLAVQNSSWRAHVGGKLAMMSDLVGDRGTVTGVDISADRLSVCKSVVHKHKLPRAVCVARLSFSVSLIPWTALICRRRYVLHGRRAVECALLPRAAALLDTGAGASARVG